MLLPLIFLNVGGRREAPHFTQAYGTLSNLYINYLILHTTDILPIALIDHKNGNTVVNR